MIKETIKEAETRMKGSIQALEEDLASIRTGRASPALVERLHVEYYGMPTPLMQLASISVPEPRILLIRPFDATSLKAIERAILASELGLTPNNDGKVIRLNIPTPRNAAASWSRWSTAASKRRASPCATCAAT